MSELLKRRKRITEPEVRYYMLQLTSALSYLHDSCIIHRDLKLGNIFLDSHMRVKVGDFGLAAKLSHPAERRKTVCGTPNYIAPEILKGKTNGHSFEVDIWSTGIIIYTLLLGRPPFEAENVDGTYRRILDIKYTFPADCGVSDAAQGLVRDILQLKPDARPSLLAIESSSFFTTASLYTPTILTSAAMRETPLDCVTATHACTYSKTLHAPVSTINDENDPNGINRPPSIPAAHHLHIASPPRKVLASNEQSHDFKAADAGRVQVNRGRASSTSRGQSTRVLAPVTAGAGGESCRRSERLRKTRLSLGVSDVAETDRHVDMSGSHPQSRRRGLQTQQRGSFGVIHGGGEGRGDVRRVSDKARQVRQFDVYAGENKSVGARVSAGCKKYTATHDSDDTRNETTEGEGGGGDRQSMEESTDAVVTEIQQNLQQIGIQSTDKHTVEMYIDDGTNPKEALQGGQAEGGYGVRHVGEPRGIYTTPCAGTGKTQHDPDTLECLYRRLESSCVEIGSSHRGGQGLDGLSDIPCGNAPKVWVVRYVDYTSKYGLGFLLNTGSAGVYFNDSTKIVLSGVGDVFQYLERRRDSTGTVELSVQTYTLGTFPESLTKKVTLLKHFKSYLLDQAQQSGLASDAQLVFQQDVEAAAGHGVVTPNPSALNGLIKDGDMPYVRKWVRTRHAILFRLSNRTIQVVFFDNSEVILSTEAREMSYRSKAGERSNHVLADVFQSGTFTRIPNNNRILLYASVYNLILTYSYSLLLCNIFATLLTGRSDIEKRIKYTKDIMARLINMQPQQKEANQSPR